MDKYTERRSEAIVCHRWSCGSLRQNVMEKVTAAITTYKREWKTVERAIRSVETQSFPMHEILLVDDNPSDSEYTRIIKKMLKEHPKVKYVSMGKNQGVSGARNLAMRIATGDFIAFLDDDDEWIADKIEKQLKKMEEHPYAALVFGYGRIIEDDTGREYKTWQEKIFNPCPSYKDMLRHDHVGSASIPLINLDVLRSTNGFFDQPAVEDYELWIRIAKHHRIYGMNDIVYIKHMDSREHVSTNHKNTFIGYQSIYQNNINAYKNNPEAKKWILYNIMREGIKARTIKVIPFILRFIVQRPVFWKRDDR